MIHKVLFICHGKVEMANEQYFVHIGRMGQVGLGRHKETTKLILMA